MDPLKRPDDNAPNRTGALAPSPGSASLGDSLDPSLDHPLHPARDAAHRITQAAGDMAHRTSEQLRHQALLLRDQSALQVREHPLRSLALAAAAGVALTLMARWLLRR